MLVSVWSNWAVVGWEAKSWTYPRHEDLPLQRVVRIRHRGPAARWCSSRERFRHTDNPCARLCRWRWQGPETFPRPVKLAILLAFRQSQHHEEELLCDRDNPAFDELVDAATSCLISIAGRNLKGAFEG